MKTPTSHELERELERVKRRSDRGRAVWDLICVMLTVAAAAVILTSYFFPVFTISGGSMAPALQSGDTYLTLKTTKVEPGEICYFYLDNEIICKRIIAVAGDVVDIDEDGNVFVNGILLDEPYVTDKAKGKGDIEFPFIVPEDSYFVMGDHRETSLDSRYAEIGCIPRERIVGVLLFRLWPIVRTGDVN